MEIIKKKFERKTMNLVVLEKGVEIASAIENILNDEFIQLTITNSFDQIHEFQTTNKIDLLLLDFDSFRNTDFIYKNIRNENGMSKIPVIFISSQPQDMDKLLSYEYYLDDFLLKPVNPVLLKAKIRRYLTRTNIIVEEYEEKIEKLKDSIKLFLPHEFRTSLSNILGYTKIINQMTKSKNEFNDTDIIEMHEMSSIVIDAANYMQRISENLILFSHLEIIKLEEKVGSEFLNCTLNNTIEIINDAIFALTVENQRKDDIELNLTPFYLNINGYLFYKIIFELIDNSFKFSPIGSKIVITTSIEKNHFWFEIKDFGKGMLQKEINNIGAFRQFERNVYEQQGIGLGLTLAKKITEMYDGTFLIRSKKSEGTLIKFSIPVINKYNN